LKAAVNLTVNGEDYELEVEPQTTLLDLLRNHLHLTGTKEGCGVGDCGTCIVLLDGEPVNSCLVLAVDAHRRRVTTIEGLEENGRLHPLQEKFLEKWAVQCGFCSPAMILSAKSLLDKHPAPGEERNQGSALRDSLPVRLLPENHRGRPGRRREKIKSLTAEVAERKTEKLE
jgi:carbon-monoxide dehydrogenase small subunit